MRAPENPPAFPSQAYGSDGLPQESASYGMTLRDWFAGQALNATIRAVASGTAPLANWVGTPAETAASLAYIMADAMLAERSGK